MIRIEKNLLSNRDRKRDSVAFILILYFILMQRDKRAKIRTGNARHVLQLLQRSYHTQFHSFFLPAVFITTTALRDGTTQDDSLCKGATHETMRVCVGT